MEQNILSSDSPIHLLYMTASDTAEADRIVHALLSARLITCANIMPAHKSIYFWEEEVRYAQEVAVIMKAPATNFSAIEALVKDLHSYDVPCLVVLPVETGHAPFLEWIQCIG